MPCTFYSSWFRAFGKSSSKTSFRATILRRWRWLRPLPFRCHSQQSLHADIERRLIHLLRYTHQRFYKLQVKTINSPDLPDTSLRRKGRQWHKTSPSGLCDAHSTIYTSTGSRGLCCRVSLLTNKTHHMTLCRMAYASY
jgi:hypothetical protein